MTATIVAVTPLHSETFSRGARMVRTALGPDVANFLEGASIIAVMLNPRPELCLRERPDGGAGIERGKSPRDDSPLPGPP